MMRKRSTTKSARLPRWSNLPQPPGISGPAFTGGLFISFLRMNKMQNPQDLIAFQKFGHRVLVTSDPLSLLPALPPAKVIIGRPIREYELLDLVCANAQPQAHAYILSSDQLHVETLKARGFSVTALIWDKRGRGFPHPRIQSLREDTEILLFGTRDGLLLRKECSDILRFQPENDPAIPPKSFWHEIFQRSTIPGDEVLNPFGRLGIDPFLAGTARKIRLTAFDSWETGDALCKLS